VVAARKYAFHEEEVFKHVSDAREMFIRAKDVKEKMQAAAKLDAALSKLLAVVEQYPDLKATESIQDLIKELSNTENRIAEQKGKYNEVARIYNQLLTTFPTNILGRVYGFGQRMPYIGAEKDLLKTPRLLGGSFLVVVHMGYYQSSDSNYFCSWWVNLDWFRTEEY